MPDIPAPISAPDAGSAQACQCEYIDHFEGDLHAFAAPFHGVEPVVTAFGTFLQCPSCRSAGHMTNLNL